MQTLKKIRQSPIPKVDKKNLKINSVLNSKYFKCLDFNCHKHMICFYLQNSSYYYNQSEEFKTSVSNSSIGYTY